MQMRYGTIYELYSALLRMQDVSGFKIAWAVAKNIKILQTEAGFFENQRIKLLKKYGQEKDGKLSINTHDEHFEDFFREFTELSDMQVDVDLYKVKDDIKEDDIRSETATARATYVVKQSDVDAGEINNTVTATGKDPKDGKVTGEDSEKVTTEEAAASIKVTKTSQDSNVKVGDTVTFTIMVKNTGNVTVGSLTLSDGLADVVVGDLDKTTIAPDETATATATYVVK